MSLRRYIHLGEAKIGDLSYHFQMEDINASLWRFDLDGITYTVTLKLPRRLDDEDNAELLEWLVDREIPVREDFQDGGIGYQYVAKMSESRAVEFKLRWSQVFGFPDA